MKLNLSPPPAWGELLPSQELATSDFNLSGPLKDALQVCRFAGQLQPGMHEELQHFSQQFYAYIITWKKMYPQYM
jgi:hypothetical protein